jgi:phosphohistidine phosphatase
MLLYLLRHANADTVAATDDGRRLSDKGREQAREVARFCQEHGCAVPLILSSPLPRAQETAQPVAEALGAELRVEHWLAAGMHPEAALEELKAHRSLPGVMIVGHEPDFSQLITHLLGLPSSTQVHVRKASLTLLALDVFRAGTARLEFSLPCKLM